jgi:hypothetical protein
MDDQQLESVVLHPALSIQTGKHQKSKGTGNPKQIHPLPYHLGTEDGKQQ